MILEKIQARWEITKGIVIIVVISAAQSLVNFALLPVFTTFLNPSSYGYLAILSNISLFFSIVSGLNISSAVAAYYKNFKSPEELKFFIGNALSFSFIFNTVLIGVLCLFGDAFTSFIFKEKIEFFPDVFLAIASGLFSNLFVLFGYYLRYDKQVFRLAILSVTQMIFLGGSQVLSLYLTDSGVRGLLYMRFITALLMVVSIFLIHRKYCFRPIQFKLNLKKPLKYSILTGPALLILWLTTYGDRFFLERFLDLETVGKYSFLVTICSIAEIVISTLNLAFQPYIYDRFAVNSDYAKNFYAAFITLCVLSFSGLIILCSNIDLFVQNDEFLETSPFIIPMIASFVFSAATNLYALQITYAQKGNYYLFLSFLVLITNTVLNFSLIPGAGITGAIIANFTTKLVMCSLFLYFSQKAFFTNTLNVVGSIAGLFLLTCFGSWLLAVSDLLNYKKAAFLQFCLFVICAFLFFRASFFKVLLTPKKIFNYDQNSRGT